MIVKINLHNCREIDSVISILQNFAKTLVKLQKTYSFSRQAELVNKQKSIREMVLSKQDLSYSVQPPRILASAFKKEGFLHTMTDVL